MQTIFSGVALLLTYICIVYADAIVRQPDQEGIGHGRVLGI